MDETGVQRRATVMLVVLVGVLVAATGLFAALLAIERTAAGQVREQVVLTERELAGARDRAAADESTVDELERDRQDTQDAVDALRVCADAATASVEAAKTGTDAELATAIDRMLHRCGR